MSSLHVGQEAVKQLLENWPITGWCQASFLKCDVIDNNMCETFNGVILDARSRSIITMLDDIRQYVMTRITVKREYVNKWRCDCDCGPKIIAKVEKA